MCSQYYSLMRPLHGSLVILLDLSAAFGILDHNILINRLTSIGISGTALD